jgi:hypothetical protein
VGFYTTDFAFFNRLNDNRQRPPKFPRTETLLTPHEDPKTPRDEWGAAEWQAYAMFLEESGKNVMKDLMRFETDLRETRQKLSRRKPSTKTGQQIILLGLLVDRKQTTRGRKPSGRIEVIVAEVLAIRSELEASGFRITDCAALEEWLYRNGKRRSRATEHRNSLNAISKYRRAHNISKR